jgi:hypothetical protein
MGSGVEWRGIIVSQIEMGRVGGRVVVMSGTVQHVCV